jgi:quinol monooxygenase YgiN
MSVGTFAIIVKFTLKPGMADAFRPLILENAVASVRDELTCHQFQVLNYEENSEIIFLYEVYEDAAALEAHRETPHFKKFIESANEMIAEREIQRCTLLHS